MNIVDFKDCSYKNKNLVGGKNSSLGELYTLSQKLNFSIADGFAITTQLYDTFIQQNNFEDFIQEQLNLVNINNIKELEKISNTLISKIISGEFTDEQQSEIEQKYNELSKKYFVNHLTVAVRSSAIAEDLPNASFAGQQDTYLNVTYIDKIIIYIKKCFASLFNTRAISYRKTHDISIDDVKISVAIQKMVRSDIASAGVAFSIDPESGYDKAIVINSSFGLGELVVSGGVKPDEIICDKQNLKDIYCDPIIMKKLGDKNTKIVYNKTEGGTEEIETNLFEQVNYSITNNNAIVLLFVIL